MFVILTILNRTFVAHITPHMVTSHNIQVFQVKVNMKTALKCLFYSTPSPYKHHTDKEPNIQRHHVHTAIKHLYRKPNPHIETKYICKPINILVKTTSLSLTFSHSIHNPTCILFLLSAAAPDNMVLWEEVANGHGPGLHLEHLERQVFRVPRRRVGVANRHRIHRRTIFPDHLDSVRPRRSRQMAVEDRVRVRLRVARHQLVPGQFTDAGRHDSVLLLRSTLPSNIKYLNIVHVLDVLYVSRTVGPVESFFNFDKKSQIS